MPQMSNSSSDFENSGNSGHSKSAAVIWFTGLSGAGKSTLADRVAAWLRGQGKQVERVDGDHLRELYPATGFDRAGRTEQVRRAGLLCHYLEKNGIFVVASLISPYADGRAEARGLCRRFFEVYLNTSLEVCRHRDVKGLYARAAQGEIAHLTGVQDAYEPPTHPELVVDTAYTFVDDSALLITAALERYLSFQAHEQIHTPQHPRQSRPSGSRSDLHSS